MAADGLASRRRGHLDRIWHKRRSWSVGSQARQRDLMWRRITGAATAASCRGCAASCANRAQKLRRETLSRIPDRRLAAAFCFPVVETEKTLTHSAPRFVRNSGFAVSRPYRDLTTPSCFQVPPVSQFLRFRVNGLFRSANLGAGGLRRETWDSSVPGGAAIS